MPGFWIPACAGMTVGRQWRLDAMALADCGVWIPAFAGMTVGGGNCTDGSVRAGGVSTGVLDSGLRRNDGGAAVAAGCNGVGSFGVWIPAFAGMTVGSGMTGAVLTGESG